MTVHSPCPPIEHYQRLLEETNSGLDADELARHLEQCDSCGRRVEQLLANIGLTQDLRAPSAAALPAPDESLRQLLDRVMASSAAISQRLAWRPWDIDRRMPE